MGLDCCGSKGPRATRKLTGLGSAHARDHQVVFVTKANRRSSIHRREYLHYIGAHVRPERGRGRGVPDLVRSRHANPGARAAQTPLVREQGRSARSSASASSRTRTCPDLMGIIQHYPRDELFTCPRRSSPRDGRWRARALPAPPDPPRPAPGHFRRSMSAVVFLPRDRYNTSVRQRIETQLFEVFDAQAIDRGAPDLPSLARLFFCIRLPYTGEVRDFDHENLESRLRAAVRSWPESWVARSANEFEDEKAGALGPVWADAFPGSYREDYEIEEAIQDLKRCEEPRGRDPDLPAEVRVAQTEDGQVRRTSTSRSPVPHRAAAPAAQTLGLRVLDQRPYTVTPADGREFQLYDFGVELPEGAGPEGPEDAKTEDLIEDTRAWCSPTAPSPEHGTAWRRPSAWGWRTVAGDARRRATCCS
ncbi:NAD-glutamate dehydrogenase [Kocuria rhizophila]|nr:NAD-glutamate dehydrogenase [Kocuria rhizophila]